MMSTDPEADRCTGAWPAEGLEEVPKCPICGTSARELLHDQTVDNVFFTAPGKWTIWRCSGCRSSYLDPRPTADSIGLAYRDYYTHNNEEAPPPKTLLRRLRSALANGYRNRRFGTDLEPASQLGYVAGRLFPLIATPLDVEYRYLPRRSKQFQKLLDVGCGGGHWLLRAQQAGWNALGADPDPTAAAKGTDLGLTIRQGGAEAWLDEAGTFDVVASNHSLEHVHDPLQMLRNIFELLRPGGQLFVETPNIDSLGHQLHGRHWLGLDPPRHLILFNSSSLKRALADTGFTAIRQHRRPGLFSALAVYSARIKAGYGFTDSAAIEIPRPSLITRLRADLALKRAEALTFTAEKPA